MSRARKAGVIVGSYLAAAILVPAALVLVVIDEFRKTKDGLVEMWTRE